MYNIVRWVLFGIVLAMVLVLSGCIQPIEEVDQTRTAQATMGFAPVSAPTQPPATQPAVTQPPATLASGVTVATNTAVPNVSQQVDGFIRQRGDVPGNLVLWGDQLIGADRLIGFSFTGSAGLPCAGYLLLASMNGAWQSTDSGALTCAQTTAIDAHAANTFILTTDGQPNTLVFGRVENPAVTQVQISFDDNSSQAVSVISGGFAVVKPGVTSPTLITGLDAQNNAVLPNIPYSPV